MVHFSTELSHSKFDYRLDKPDRFFDLLPYLFKKLSGEWNIELVDFDIGTVREILDHTNIPDYVSVYLVLAGDVIGMLQAERPELKVTKKSVWEYYNDLLAELPILIDSKAASMLYNRLPRNRTVIKQAIDSLSKSCEDKGIIEISDVRNVTLSHNVYYSNQVVRAFAEHDRNRWKIFDQFELELGTHYAFYALRKYVNKLLKDKSNYLSNDEYKDKNVEVVDTYMIIFLLGRFNTYKPEQLICIFSEFDRMRKGEKVHALL